MFKLKLRNKYLKHLTSIGEGLAETIVSKD